MPRHQDDCRPEKKSNLWPWILAGELILVGLPLLVCAGVFGFFMLRSAISPKEFQINTTEIVRQDEEKNPNAAVGEAVAAQKDARPIRMGMRAGADGAAMIVGQIVRKGDEYVVSFRSPPIYVAHFHQDRAAVLKQVRPGDRIGFEGRFDERIDEVEKGVERIYHLRECRILLIQQEAGRDRNGNIILNTTYRQN